MSEVVQQLCVLLNSEDFAMTALTRPEADVEALREGLGVEPLSQALQATFKPSDYAMLRALVRSIDPARDPTVSQEFLAMPPLLAVAAFSAEAHAVLLTQLAYAATERGEAGRFKRLVDCCCAPQPSLGGEERAAHLTTAAHALGVLNEIISSPAQLSVRMGLRDECTALGLQAAVGALGAMLDGDEGAPQSLLAQLDVFTTEVKADEREKVIEDNPLEEFAGCCVVLYTSIATNIFFNDRWKHVEALLEMMEVGFVGVDAALPDRKRAREALWKVSGHTDYPQVFADKKYVGGYEEVQKMVEEDAAREERLRKMNADTTFGVRKLPQLPKGVGFHSTFAPWIGQAAVKEDRTLSYQ